MPQAIPEPILHADEVHNQILQQVSFSQHLNPVNVEPARQAFMRGAPSPPFRYKPLSDADEIIARLDEVEPDREHPAGALVGRCLDRTRVTVRALRDRTASAFHLLASL